MANQTAGNIKLGAFVLSGLFVLILAFYLIGKNHNLFGSDFNIRVRFSNLNGLTVGNNVQFSGIQSGTVKKINMINDTTIEVTLSIDNKFTSYIHKNAVASIGTEGLMGNKIVNIVPSNLPSPQVIEDDLLIAQKKISTDEMLQTLSKTNNNVAVISEALKGTVLKVNGSTFMALLNDKNVSGNLLASLQNLNKASANAIKITNGIDDLIVGIKNGKGAAGVLLRDTIAAGNLQAAISSIRKASDNADSLTWQLNNLARTVNGHLNSGNGSLPMILKDSAFAKDLRATMYNLRQGTDGFNKNMEALKHNFLFRGYFKSQEKARRKQQAVQSQ